MTARKTAKSRARKDKAAQTRKAIDAMGPERSGRLGAKYTCFACEARFYDLNKPEPLCPKCGANQLEKPKEPKPASDSPPKPKAVRPLAPIDDEEEVAPAAEEGAELEIGGIASDAGLLDDGEELSDAGDIETDDD